MSQENVDRLRGAYEGLNRGAADLDLLAPNFELHQASSIIDPAGVFHGPGAILDVVAELEEAFENFRAEAEQLIEAPGGEIVVLVRASGRGRGSGAERDNHFAHVWTFRGAKAVRMVVYEEQAEALEAVGLRE